MKKVKNRKGKNEKHSCRCFSSALFWLIGIVSCVFLSVVAFALDEADTDELTEVALAKEKEITVLSLPNGNRFLLEVASRPVERQLGLMYRISLRRNEGMIFVFADDKRRRFWMRNTTIPLSIAFLDKDGVVLQIEDMVPLSTEIVESQLPARYAIEVNKGDFQLNDVVVGTSFDIPTELDATAQEHTNEVP